MENEKKPSCLGVRLSAIIVAVLLVVCMAVPAFAVSVEGGGPIGNYPFNEYSFNTPEGYDYYVVIPFQFSGYKYQVFAFKEIPDISHFYATAEQYNTAFTLSNFAHATTVIFTGLEDFEWQIKDVNDSTPVQELSNSYRSNFIANFEIYYGDGTVFYSPPPPPPLNPLETVGAGLVVVMDWVGSVVSAVVSGPMSGLLILLAVPVAITLLLVAFIVIRRIIWGA